MLEGVLFLAALGALAGFCIGCIGVGGVIIVPALVYLGGFPVQIAIASAMMGYIVTGLIGTTIYARRGSINWTLAFWLCAGAMPAALLGAWGSNIAPAALLELGIAGMTLLSGVQALKATAQGPAVARSLGPGLLVLIGALTGLLSALTGTGGPLVLVPMMIWLELPILTAIGLSQAVQLPIAALATAGNFMFGSPDILLGGVLAAGLASGAAAGAFFAHSLGKDLLKPLVGIVLIIVGCLIILRLAVRALYGAP